MRRVILRSGGVLRETPKQKFKIRGQKVEIYKKLHPKLNWKYQGYYNDVVGVEMV